jgi:hypothetical protein
MKLNVFLILLLTTNPIAVLAKTANTTNTHINKVSTPVHHVRKIIPHTNHKLSKPNDLRCFVDTVYREGENQSLRTKRDLMHVIHNRVKLWHASVCTIVNQPKQFSHRWLHNIKTDDVVINLAKNMLAGKLRDTTGGAIFFHDDSLKKNPFPNTKLTVKSDNMLFYKTLT